MYFEDEKEENESKCLECECVCEDKNCPEREE